MGDLMVHHGVSWHLYRDPLEGSPCTHEVSRRVLWDPHGVSHGAPWGLPWDAMGSPMKHHRVFHGAQLGMKGHNRVSHWAAWGLPLGLP